MAELNLMISKSLMVDPALTSAEETTLLWLPASAKTHIYGVYPHDDSKPIAADTLERDEVLFGLENNRRHALVTCVAVDRPGMEEPWRNRRWVLTKLGFEARTALEAGHG